MWKHDIAGVRAKLAEIGHRSQTSLAFQDDVLDFVATHRGEGDTLVEIGCYHGGFTAQLAVLARALNLRLDVIDIDRDNLAMAAKAVAAAGVSDHVRFHRSYFTSFVKRNSKYAKPILVFVDGDHRYKGVVADIRAIRSMEPSPHACAFHDYSLRYADGPLTTVRVDRAIHDEFGDDIPLMPIGEVAGTGRTLRTKPGADRHFHEEGRPEGVIITLAEVERNPDGSGVEKFRGFRKVTRKLFSFKPLA